jgi:hypothetical protein
MIQWQRLRKDEDRETTKENRRRAQRAQDEFGGYTHGYDGGVCKKAAKDGGGAYGLVCGEQGIGAEFRKGQSEAVGLSAQSYKNYWGVSKVCGTVFGVRIQHLGNYIAWQMYHCSNSVPASGAEQLVLEMRSTRASGNRNVKTTHIRDLFVHMFGCLHHRLGITTILTPASP